MRNNIFFTFVLMLLVTLSASAQADAPFNKGGETGVLPVIKKGFLPQVSVAPQIAYVNFYDAEISGISYGAEIALQCPLVCTKKNYIRQQVSILYFKDTNLSILEATLNPEYRFVAKPTFEFAAGPSLGYLNSKATVGDISESKGYFSYGLSASATQHFGSKMFIGVGARQNWAGENLGHFQALLKLGIKL